MNKKEIVFKLTFWLSILLYTISMCLSGCSTPNSNEDNLGYLLVLFGWSEVFAEGASYVWLANPLLWYSWITMKNTYRSLLFGSLSMVLASTFMFSSKIMPIETCGSWLEPMDCSPVFIISKNSGYYLWLFSSMVITAGNLYRMKFHGSGKQKPR